MANNNFDDTINFLRFSFIAFNKLFSFDIHIENLLRKPEVFHLCFGN